METFGVEHANARKRSDGIYHMEELKGVFNQMKGLFAIIRYR
jgi:hypothetical protein